MRQSLNIKEQKKEFKSHKELDEFVAKLIQEEPMFEENYPHEWGLLKSFDRAFWLRHVRLNCHNAYITKPFQIV